MLTLAANFLLRIHRSTETEMGISSGFQFFNNTTTQNKKAGIAKKVHVFEEKLTEATASIFSIFPVVHFPSKFFTSSTLLTQHFRFNYQHGPPASQYPMFFSAT